MKTKLIYLLFILWGLIFTDLCAQSTKQNHIVNRTYTSNGGGSYLDVIQYYDGLGRPSQTVQAGASPSKQDLVSLQEYDNYGRASNAWLPAIKTSNQGNYVPVSEFKNLAISSNGNDQKPYSYPVYEASTLNRILEQYGPGNAWHANKKAVKTEYLANTASGVQSCIYFSATGTLTATTLKKNTNYAAGELFVTKMTDEDQNVSYEFKDKRGQVVLTRQMVGTTQHDTYYVYDDFGNLCYVLPPLAVDKLSGTSFADTHEVLRQYAYVYKYDNRNRCIKKRLPGTANDTNDTTGWIYYVYDKADQLIFTQDGEQRKNGQWAFAIPDIFGRVILTGICKNTLTVGNEIAAVVKATWPTTPTTNVYKGYTVSGITLASGFNITTVNYYDNYEFLGLNSIPNTSNTQYVKETGYGVCHGDHQAANKHKNKGLLTGTLTAQMNPNGSFSSSYLYSVMYYDNKGRIIQTKSNNHLAGGIEKEYIEYNFVGLPESRMHIHEATGKTTQTEVYNYRYDHAGRLLTTDHYWNGTPTLIATNTYDELGRLKTNKKGSHNNLLTTYQYNIRSWTTKISSPLFTQNLYYNTQLSGATSNAQWGGNVSGMSWTVQGEAERKYGFVYDGLSRLKDANYAGAGQYTSNYTYDKHGNIMSIVQKGLVSGTTYNTVDNLALTYVGNQLNNVHDSGTNATVTTSADFQDYSKDAAKTKKEYAYNANGAMTQDLNKGITTIQYNSLNLPRLMDIKHSKAEARNEYTYSADGQKLRVKTSWNPSFSQTPIIGSAINVGSLTQSKITDYVGNKIYEGGATPKRILIDGGYIEGTTYYYYLNDHLGNNRVVANASGTVVQKTHYYPFGMAFAETTGQNVQPYKYNGKELDTQHGLNTYDYAARYMDPAIGRFTSIDPLAEKHYAWSPYVYVLNNPYRFIDPTGMTEEERLAAIAKMREFMGDKDKDCSEAVDKAIRESTDIGTLKKGSGIDKENGSGKWDNGVALIVSNSREVTNVDNVQEGNTVTFKSDRSNHKGEDGKFDHIGIVSSITRGEDGSIASFAAIHKTSSKGVTEQTFDTSKMSEKQGGFWVKGFQAWDTPDNYAGGTASSAIGLPTITVTGIDKTPLPQVNAPKSSISINLF